MSASPSINLSGLFPGASTGLLDVIKQIQQAQTSANTANEKRYQDILGMYGGLGQAGMTRIGQAETQQQAKATQDLTSRGLGNTTVTSSVNRGISNDAELQRQQLQEQVALLKGGVMERKNEQGPDMSLYTNLLSQAAQDRPRMAARTTVRVGGSAGSGGYLYNPQTGGYD